MSTIEVVAALIVNEQGETLMVRKHGTNVFIQPGGKPEPGETPVAALQRELNEELGLVLQESDLDFIGIFESDAANEPGFRVRSHAFWCLAQIDEVAVDAEIAEARWVDPSETSLVLAPLSREYFLPLIRTRSGAQETGPKIGTWR